MPRDIIPEFELDPFFDGLDEMTAADYRTHMDGFHRGVRAAIAALYYQAGEYEVAIAERAEVAGPRWLGLAQRIQRGAERCADMLNETYEAIA